MIRQTVYIDKRTGKTSPVFYPETLSQKREREHSRETEKKAAAR